MIIDYSVIGKQIQRIRKEKHLSRQQLSAMAGISSGHLGHIETGSKSPSVEILVNIAFSLDVPVDELLKDLDLPQKGGLEMSGLLENCSPGERSVLRELIAAIKPVLQKLDL